MAWQEKIFENKKKKERGVYPCIYIRGTGNHCQEKFLDFLL